MTSTAPKPSESKPSAARTYWIASDFKCDYCFSTLTDHPDNGTISEGHSGYSMQCPNCGIGYNALMVQIVSQRERQP